MLPNLLIIGAAKCGTTSLHEYLALHPEIAMSSRKELKYFTMEDWREKVAWYESHFSERAPLRGESTPGYTMFPFLPSTAERIHELIPNAKLIYVVRDPVERAIASYVEFFALRFEDRPIAQALSDESDPANPHICGSRYASQLERFLECFDPSQILVLDHAELLQRRELTLAETFEFLGVDSTFDSPEFARIHNTRTAKVRYNDLGYWLVKHRILTTRQGPFRHGPLVGPLRRLLSRPIDTTLPRSARKSLLATLSPEVSRLREQTGKDFASWQEFPLESSDAEFPLPVRPS